VAAAVVKFNALADAVGPAADDQNFFLLGDADLILGDQLAGRIGVRLFVRAVVVRGDSGELRGAGVN